MDPAWPDPSGDPPSMDPAWPDPSADPPALQPWIQPGQIPLEILHPWIQPGQIPLQSLPALHPWIQPGQIPLQILPALHPWIQPGQIPLQILLPSIHGSSLARSLCRSSCPPSMDPGFGLCVAVVSVLPKPFLETIGDYTFLLFLLLLPVRKWCVCNGNSGVLLPSSGSTLPCSDPVGFTARLGVAGRQESGFTCRVGPALPSKEPEGLWIKGKHRRTPWINQEHHAGIACPGWGVTSRMEEVEGSPQGWRGMEEDGGGWRRMEGSLEDGGVWRVTSGMEEDGGSPQGWKRMEGHLGDGRGRRVTSGMEENGESP
ncbi:uncharacterized protein LOC128852121 [Cuculus canorus]|uniref:uncharacterized protein LOC128852121 n=1 Tax=Cuculus canorus TaxID=55661 RepID=UPI0023AAE223|nr:uncharacterized protein LOC128852121 [Cuculus canorus]